MAQQYEMLAERINTSMALTAELMHEMHQTITFLTAKVEELTNIIHNSEKEEYRLIKVDEAAKMLGVSVSTLKRRIENGEIPAWKSNRALRVSYNHIQSMITPKK